VCIRFPMGIVSLLFFVLAFAADADGSDGARNGFLMVAVPCGLIYASLTMKMCRRCRDSGQIPGDDPLNHPRNRVRCPDCGGTGRKR